MLQSLSRKKILPIILAIAVAVAMIIIPQTQESFADSGGTKVAKKVTVVLYGKSSEYFFYMGNGGTITSLKSSKKSVVKIPKGSTGLFIAKKAGKAKVTVKYKKNGKKKTMKCTVTVKKYKNPFKKIMIGDKNYAPKLNKMAGAQVKFGEGKAKVKVTTAKGWKLKSIEVATNDGDKKIKNGDTIDLDEVEYISFTMKNGKFIQYCSLYEW